MELSLDTDRLAAIRNDLKRWLLLPPCSRKDLQSLIGTLSFAAKVVPAGRSFLRRMLDTLAVADRTNARTVHLSDDFRADLRWWHRFSAEWNGRSVIPTPFWSNPAFKPPNAQWAITDDLYTDACLDGYGAVFGKHWTHGRWTHAQRVAAQRAQTLSMPYLEMLAIALALATWAPLLSGRRLTVRSDAKSAVEAFRTGTSKDAGLMGLIRPLLFIAATHHFAIRIEHISGSDNDCADALSRNEITTFVKLSPASDFSPTPTGVLPTPDW